ncbi:MAG: DNA polymerase/3'-5' exonuclease PolX [Chloroflexi bacterium]|nr:DNA polymerase/3'-5' exonuclease PolX [Chloroflexota bacterium]
MPVHNVEVADIFNELADLLEIEGANEFRIRAYRTAARNITDLPQSVSDLLERGEDLSKLPGIGKDLAGKIAEIVQTGKLSHLEDIKKRIPAGLLELMRVTGVGPKRAGALYRELGIESLKALEKAAREGQIQKLRGFGKKTEQNILEELGRKGEQEEGKRIKLSAAEEIARPFLAYLRKTKGVKYAEVAGSYRRRKETVRDLDVLAVCQEDCDVMQRFTEYEDVVRVLARGETRSTVILRYGIHVDLRVVPEVSYGAALHYFTGSKAHNIAIRHMGVKRGLKINEYGVFRGEKRIAGRTEEEVFAQVGLPYIEPELRENWGEIEAAQEGRLPKLVTLEDIHGDLHSHTTATEGHATVEEMAYAAQERGYEYLAITDHSKRLSMTHGLDEKRLGEQIREVDRLNQKMEGFTILKGVEVDIMDDGSLDLPDGILKELDMVVFSVHHKLNLSRDEQTERIIKAMRNPYATILAHPTGRLINEREPYDVDMERLMKAARETGCIMELNAQPERLDLNDVYCKMSKEMGAMVAISTDAHSVNELEFMRFGIAQAHRGWLETSNVVNTRSLGEIKKLLRGSLSIALA